MTVVKEMIKERVRRAQVHDYVQKKTSRAGFGGLSIQRTPLGTHVRIAAERPGLVIGRKGSDIQKLTEESMSKTIGNEETYKARSKLKLTHRPPWSRLNKRSLPPCANTISLHRAKPTPVP